MRSRSGSEPAATGDPSLPCLRFLFLEMAAPIRAVNYPQLKLRASVVFSTSFELPSTVSYTQMAVMRRKSRA